MRYSRTLMGRQPSFLYTSTGAGLLDKSARAHSWLGLSDEVSYLGVFLQSADNDLNIDYDLESHVNNAQDPSSVTLSVLDSVSLSVDRPRQLTSDLSIDDFVHVDLAGYHPSGGTTEATLEYQLTANETIAIGQPVYISSSNTVNLADADTETTSKVIGLATEPSSANSSVNVAYDGSVNQSDWSSVTGSANLTPGSTYYLSVNSGELTTTAPSADGDTVVRVGTAVSESKMDIEVNEVATL